MTGYTFQTEQEAITARQAAADYQGLPVPNGTTYYWVDYSYSEPDNFWYIIHTDKLEEVLGTPIEFELSNGIHEDSTEIDASSN
jgi:hypothetical protein